MWGIIIIAGLAVLIILILCVPLYMAIHADVYGKPKFRMRFSWLFGTVSKEITRKEKKPEEKKEYVKGKGKRGRGDRRVIFKILRTKGVLRQFKALLKDTLSHFNFRHSVTDFKIGFGDPADTGFVFAIIGPAMAFLGSSSRHRIRLEPYFGDEATLEGYSHGIVRVQPIRLIPPVLKFAFSLTAMRVVRILISSNRNSPS